MTQISADFSSTSLSTSSLFSFILSHLIPILSHLCVSLTCFLFCSPDTGDCVYTVCHDSWDQAELDRGFKEVCPAEQLARPHTVSAIRILKYKIFNECK